MADVRAECPRQDAMSEETTLLIPGADYPIHTPDGNELTAQDLPRALRADEVVAPGDERQQ